MELEWSRHVVTLTGGKVLIFAPPQVIPQTIDESERFYPRRAGAAGARNARRSHLVAVRARRWFRDHELRKNDRRHHSEMRNLAGLVLDESSILKSGGGVIKWNLIKSAKGIEYKLSCTATPAPNDVMEYASQAAFLEKLRTEGEILWTFFSRINKGPNAGNWMIKPHARDGFYRFMASWSIYLRNPAAYGWPIICATCRSRNTSSTESSRPSSRCEPPANYSIRRRGTARRSRAWHHGANEVVAACEGIHLRRQERAARAVEKAAIRCAPDR